MTSKDMKETQNYNKLINIARDYVDGKITKAQAENYACIWADERNHWDKGFLKTLENYIYKLRREKYESSSRV